MCHHYRKMKVALEELRQNPPSPKTPGSSGFTPNEKGYLKEARVRELYGVPDISEGQLPKIRSTTGSRSLDAPVIPGSSYAGETTPALLIQVKAVSGQLSKRDLQQIVVTIRSAEQRKALVMLHVDADTVLNWNARSSDIQALLTRLNNAISRGRVNVRIGD